MSVRRIDLPGTWPALAGDVLVYALGSSVLAERVTPAGALEPIAAKPTPEPLMFLAAALSPAGDLAIVGKGQQSGVAVLVTAAGVDALGPSHGNRPCAIAWDGTGFVIRWVIRPGVLASIVHGERLPDAPIPAPWTGTATGLLDLDVRQQPIWMDAARSRIVGGWTFTEPIQRGAAIVGQGDPPGVYVSPDGTSVFQALADPMAESPDLSLLANGRILACAYTTHGASLAIVDPPYPSALSAVPAVGRPLWVGWFEFAIPADPPPGNCTLATTDLLLRRRPDAAVIAQYVAAEQDGTLAGLQRVINAVEGVPVLAYWTRALQTGAPPRCEYVGVEAYCYSDETLASFEARIRTAVAKTAHAMLIAECYTSNFGLRPNLASLVPVYARIARECPQVVGIIAFSDAGRPTGLTDHPDVRPLWAELFAGVTGIPPLPDVEEDEMQLTRPAIDVQHFDSQIKAGQPWQTEFVLGGQTAVTVRIGADGNLTIKASNPAGDDATGVRRTVTVG